ncbi:hypothetical protein CLAFUR0_13007 [Fulvia fulva]|nr:hypothetical protein CLAFUR0_13007 [Fulvia fulva]
MGDIQHWRRMIQPNRARTPAVEPDETEEFLSPPIPQKGRLKRKVSSYFDFSANVKPTAASETASESQLPTWPQDQLYPDPKAEDEMDSIFCRLMSEPYSPLDVQFNGSLMRIFESYVKLQEEKHLLQERLDQETNTKSALVSKFNMAEKDWQDEMQDYKEEVKRLEVLLAKASRRGLAEVTLARQDSKLRSRKAERQDGRETFFEFLEETTDKTPPPRRHDSVYDNQRATMKPLLQSPSAKDKQMSRTLVAKKSMTNIHSDLPFGTPPNRDMRFSLTNISLLDQKTKHGRRPRAATDASTASTFSAFSCEAVPVVQIFDTDIANHEQEDLHDIQRLVMTLARRRNADPHHVVPQLLNVLRAQPVERLAGSAKASNTLQPWMHQRKPTTSARITSGSTTIKRQTVMSKASGLLQRLKPQPSAEVLHNTRPVARRFSFEEGDDTAAQSAPLEDWLPKDGQHGKHLLRKSASLGTLQNTVVTSAVVESTLSPVAASPTTPGPVVETQFPSRIPVLSPGLLAKPRAEREDSASSLLTAVKHSDNATKRSSSLTSSAFSSPSASREDISKATRDQCTASCVRSVSSNHLLDHASVLRGSADMIAYAAARAASVSSDMNSDLRADRKRPGASSSCGRYSILPQKENNRQENARILQSSRIPDHDTG